MMMKMTRKKRKAFTIVELVIVIAVIGVLAAVLIPTFSNVITKAEQSVALQEVKQAYTETLADDIASEGVDNVLGYDGDIIVLHENGTYVLVNENGEASVLEEERETTHTLTNNRLIRKDNPTQPHVHTEVVLPAKAATCIETGLTEGKKCSECGDILIRQVVIPAEGHVFKLDSSENGNLIYKCDKCSETYTESVEIEIKPDCSHNNTTEETTPATCTEAGKEVKTCNNCNIIIEIHTIPALGHTYDNNCDAKCNVCSFERTVTHTFGNWVSDNTNHWKECSECKEESEKEVHKYVDGTCECGAKSSGGEEPEQPVDPDQPEQPEHTHTEEVLPAKEATCTEAGSTEGKKCSTCGEILVAQTEVPAKGHNYVDGKCTVCGADDPNYETGLIVETTAKICVGGEPLHLTLNSAAAGKNLTWISSNKGLATVDNGKVTGIAMGTVIITVITEDGESDICDITIYDHNYVYIQNGDTHNKKCINCGYNANESHFYDVGTKDDMNSSATCACGAEVNVLDKCTHTSADGLKYENSNSEQVHQVFCSKCHITFTEEHDFISDNSQKCRKCGYCTHKTSKGVTNYKAYEEIENNNTSHYKICSVCQKYSMDVHEKVYNSLDNGTQHQQACSECSWKLDPEEHTFDENGACTDCHYSKCKHENCTYIPVNDQYHKLSCCGMTEKHELSGGYGCTKCTAWIVNSGNYNQFKSKAGSLQKRTVFIQSNTISEFDVQLGTSNKGNAIVDLCGGTLNYKKTTFSIVNVNVITLKNGTIKTSQETIANINEYVAKGYVILEGVTLVPNN